MHLTSLTILLALLAMTALRTAAANHLRPFQQSSTLDTRTETHIHDTTGPITLNFHSPPLRTQQRAETSTAQLNSRLIGLDFFAAFLTYQLLRAVFRWVSNGALTVVRAQLGVTTGRTVTVAQSTQATTASAVERHARSLSATIHSETATLPREPSSLAGSALIEHRFDSNHSIGTDPSNEATSLAHRLEYGGVVNQGFVVQPATSYPGIHHVLDAGSSRPERVESPNQSGVGSFAPRRSSSGHLGSNADDHPPLAENSPDLISVRIVLALSILVVGCDWAHRPGWHLPGVAHDINWLKWICSGLNPAVTLDALTDGIRENIRSKILGMFLDACPGTTILLYFNGHGNGSFMLYDETVVDAATVVAWIIAIRQETDKHLPVCIVFDHCRFDSPTPPPVKLGQDMYIIWACMPGQRCADFRMNQDPHIPFSNFLKAFSLLVIEACSHPASSVDDLMSRLNAWMEVVVRMMLGEVCNRNECPTLRSSCSCPNYGSCTHAATRSRRQNPLARSRTQSPNGMFSGFMDGVRRVRTREVLEWLDPAVKSILDPVQKAAEKIRKHEKYTTPTNTMEPPTESPLYAPAGLRVRRGRNTDAAELRSQPLAI